MKALGNLSYKMKGIVLCFPMIMIMIMVAGNVTGTSLPSTEHMIDWGLKSDLQTWSLNSRFYIGDTLVFKYNKTKRIDVQEVGPLGFTECKTDNPIWTDDDGETVVHLRLSGPMYFIPSIKHYCKKGLKLQVMVTTNPFVVSPSGSEAWGTSLPPTEYMIDWGLKSDLQTWSLNTRFYVGDALVFTYNKTKGIDVQEVDPLGFIECKTDSPIWIDGDGETVVHLRLPGPMYFIPSIKH